MRADSITSEVEDRLQEWRQGDYSCDITAFALAHREEDSIAFLNENDVIGWVVVTQTCDIVNCGNGKEAVVVAPMIRAGERLLLEVTAARTPLATSLENPPEPDAVVDLGRMMSIHKSLLATLNRREGFRTDLARSAFGEALARKHGRFAFPDEFSAKVLSYLRDKIKDAHRKLGSEAGKAYRSIREIRAMAAPSWDAPVVNIGFLIIIEDTHQGDLSDIRKALDNLFKKVPWPASFKPEEGFYDIGTFDDFSARQYVESQLVDLGFISIARD